MKQFSRVLLVAAGMAALPVGAGVAMAGGDHMRSPECRAAHDARFLPTYDANKNGVLDRSERQAMRQDRRKQAVARYDADRDGQLSEVERTKLRRDKLAEKFARLDKDRNGAISRDEAAGPCSPLASRFDAIDTDRNGNISAAELEAARMFGRHGKRRFAQPQGDEEAVEEAPEPAPQQ